jgi:YidC/Oxa1 family membrane protein insertase
MFTTFIVQPIFNLLVAIYAVLPGHNFGLAVILFTILVRLLMWPLIKKQLHQSKLIRKIQPELKRIKKAANGDKMQERTMMMELYKEHGISPFATIGPLLLQLPIFIGLYLGLQRIVRDPNEIVTFAYDFLQKTPSLQELAQDISRFDSTLFGFVDLTRAAISTEGFYLPAFIIVVASVVVQFFQAKQLIPTDKDARSLRQILKEAGDGKQADQSEVNAAIGRSTKYLLPALIFFFTIGIASALSLYWLTSGLVAYIQQARVLGRDEDEMEAMADAPSKKPKAVKSTSTAASEPLAPGTKVTTTKSGLKVTISGPGTTTETKASPTKATKPKNSGKKSAKRKKRKK